MNRNGLISLNYLIYTVKDNNYLSFPATPVGVMELPKDL